MYTLMNYQRIFEETTQPLAFNPKDVLVMVSLTDTDADEFLEKIEVGGIFKRPGKVVNKNSPETPIQLPGIGAEVMIAFLIAGSDDKAAVFPNVPADLDPKATLMFNAYPKQLKSIENLAAGQNITVPGLVPVNGNVPLQINFNLLQEESTAPESQPQSEEPTTAAEDEAIANAAETGELMPESAILSFDSFVGEAKKSKDEKWIKDIDMKKGALRKEMKKGEEEKITAAELAKSEAKLKKKDKDKKKPGLQLNAKDAKTHKRNVLAKNLMKASGAIKESRQERIKGIKDQLVKLHEVVEKMIAQTARKNKGI